MIRFLFFISFIQTSLYSNFRDDLSAPKEVRLFILGPEFCSKFVHDIFSLNCLGHDPSLSFSSLCYQPLPLPMYNVEIHVLCVLIKKMKLRRLMYITYILTIN